MHLKTLLTLTLLIALASPALAATCRACVIDKAPRKREQPSDHTPVVADFSL